MRGHDKDTDPSLRASTPKPDQVPRALTISPNREVGILPESHGLIVRTSACPFKAAVTKEASSYHGNQPQPEPLPRAES